MSTDHYSNPFDENDIISKYDAADAVEDGVLVLLTKKDLVHRNVWEAFAERTPKTAQPPNCWPVDLLGWFQATKVSATEAIGLITKHGAVEGQKMLNAMITDRKVSALCKGIVSTHAKQATRVYNENIGGGIYTLYAELQGTEFDEKGILSELSLTNRGVPALKLWLMPNECGGVTLLFPEDY